MSQQPYFPGAELLMLAMVGILGLLKVFGLNIPLLWVFCPIWIPCVLILIVFIIYWVGEWFGKFS